jgi:hypothetical protein
MPNPAAAHSYRVWVAFALLPFADALIGYLGFPLVWYMGGHSGQLVDPEGAARGLGIVAGVLGLLTTLAGAVPIVIWLLQRGPVSLAQLLGVGVLLGNGPFLLYVVGLVLPATVMHLANGTMADHLSPLSELIAGTLRAIAVGSVIGAWSALVFWFVGIYKSSGYIPTEL